MGKIADDLDFGDGISFEPGGKRIGQVNRRDEAGRTFAADDRFPLFPASDFLVLDDDRLDVALQTHFSQPERDGVRAAEVAHGDCFAAKLVQGCERCGHDKLKAAVDLRRAEKGNFPSPRGLRVKIFDMLDNDVAGFVEQRGFEDVAFFDLDNLDIDPVMALRHGFDAVDHRCAVVVPIRKANGRHNQNGPSGRLGQEDNSLP